MKYYLNSLVVAVISFLWSYIYYADGLWAEDYTRPFVYRQLVPLLARGIEFLGVPGNIALIVVMTLSGVGFYLSLRILAIQFYTWSDRQDIYLLAGTLASMLVLGIFRKPYDLMTACLVSLFLYYFWTGQKVKHLIVFALACLNRETAILLVLFYVVFLLTLLKYKSVRWEIVGMSVLQGVIYLLITLGIRYVFVTTEGSSAWIEPAENILKFANQPYRFMLHLYGLLGLLWWMSRGWERKPYYLRYAFGLFAPLLLIMYVVFGQAFEIRVFWEIAPLVILLSLPKP